MGSKLLSDSICTSDTIAQLTWFEEVLFYRLITHCDDAGRYDARPAIVKGTLFPLADVTVSQIDKAIKKLSSVGLVEVYSVNAKPILQMKTWAKYQRIRNVQPKYPGPENVDNQSAADCRRLPQTAADCGLNPIQSESNPNPNPNPDTRARYGQYQNVRLTDTQLAKLKAEFPDTWQQWIDRLDGWIQQNGKDKYKDHLATIRNWSKRDEEKLKAHQKGNSFTDYTHTKTYDWDALEAYETANPTLKNYDGS